MGAFVMKSLIARFEEGYTAARADSHQQSMLVALTANFAGVYWTSDTKLWVPEYDNLRHDRLDAVQSHPFAGHYGVRRTHHLLSRMFYWPGMLATVKHFVQHCDSCQRSTAPRQLVFGHLHPLSIPDSRWQSVSLDLITDLPLTARGYDTVVVCVHRLAKMMPPNP
jgi:hypothetical protein